MFVVFDHEQLGDPLHAHETAPGLGAFPIESDAAVIGELQNPLRRLGIGAEHAGMYLLRRGIDVFPADPQRAAAALLMVRVPPAWLQRPIQSPVADARAGCTGVRLADGSQPTVQLCLLSPAD